MIRKSVVFVLLLICCVVSHSQRMPDLYSSVDENRMLQWVDSVFNRLSDDERIGQLFMVIASPTTEAKNLNKLLQLVENRKIGGVLFQKGNPEAQVQVTNRIQRASRVPLLIALDGEWGLSMRLSNTTRFPKNMMLGAIPDVSLIEQYGEEVGRQCREMGIHINFAPDMDVNSNPDNPVIGNRSFGEDPLDVTRRAIAYSRGLERAGIISCAKHFPGHGDTQNDSHLSLPTINHDIKRLNNIELYPFDRYIKAGFSGVMTGHLNIPALGTNGRPSSLSPEIVSNLLHDEMGFRGLRFTDALSMKGAVIGKNESISVLAIKAGNDVLLGMPEPEKEIEEVKSAVNRKILSMKDINEKCRLILCYKYIAGLNHYKPLKTEGIVARLNTPRADWLNAKMNAEAVTILKNKGNMLPLKQLGKKRIAAVSLSGQNNNDFHFVLKRYDNVDCYNLAADADSKTVKNIFDKLYNYDLIICSIHSEKAVERRELQSLAAKKDVILVFFTTPYKCSDFVATSESAQSIVLAYEPTVHAESYAAQVIFGGIAAKGSLSVGVPGMFALGTGYNTAKTRLGFHKPYEVGMNPDKLLVIDSIVREGMKKEAYPGCRVLVAKDGMVVYNKSFGYYDYSRKQEVKENTVYDLASVTKTVATLLAVMKSYDNGDFNLTDRISDYVPELKITDKQDIVIRDMLYHQSGLPAIIPFYEQAINHKSYTGSLNSRRKDASHTYRYDSRTYVNTSFKYNPTDVSTVKKNGFSREIAKNLYVSDTFVKDSIMEGIIRAKITAPGKYTYSCVNFILLKLMIENMYNKGMDKILDDFFYSNLGASTMTYNPLRKIDTLLIAPTENDQFLKRKIIRGYVHDEAAAFQGGVSGNAGLFSTAGDLAKVAQMFLNDGVYGNERYISSKTCRLFTESKSPDSRRALGFDKPDNTNKSNSPCGLLAPDEVYGHTGYTGTCFWIDPVNKMFFIFLSNRTYPTRANNNLSTLNIRTRIQDAIYRAME